MYLYFLYYIKIRYAQDKKNKNYKIKKKSKLKKVKKNNEKK